MPKRTLDAAAGEKNEHSHKKHRKQDHGDQKQTQQAGKASKKSKKSDKTSIPFTEALSNLPPQTSALNTVSGYIPFTVDPGLPDLPPVKEGPLSSAPFTHKSMISHDRNTVDVAQGELSYERLEFLGDTYLELIASRLIFARFSHLPAGQMSQLREQLVKNETLCEYGRAYGFDRRVTVTDMARMQAEARDRGNKGFNKVVGDVFEAYIAAVVLSDVDNGFATAEKWLTALWAPRLVAAARQDRSYDPTFATKLVHAPDADRRTVYNPTAKNELQRKLLRGDVTLAYEPYKDSVELKGAQLGQNRHYIAVYLTGYGYEKQLLGKGEGKNKVEAGNWAATEAIYGKGKRIVDECEEKVQAAKAARIAGRTAKEETDHPTTGDTAIDA